MSCNCVSLFSRAEAKGEGPSNQNKLGGILLLTMGVVMVILAALCASGMLTTYFRATTAAMYFTACGLMLAALIPIISGTVTLVAQPQFKPLV